MLAVAILGIAICAALIMPGGAKADSCLSVAPNANDNLAGAVALTPAQQGCALAPNADATSEPGEHAGVGAGRTVWFTWTAPDNQSEIFDTFGSACSGDDLGCTNGLLNSVVSVFTGTSLVDLQPATNVLNNNVLSSTDLWNCKFTIWQSCFQIVHPTPGQTYFLQVDDFGNMGGTVQVNWRRPPIAPHTPVSNPPFQQPGNVVDTPTPTFHLEDSGATFFLCWIDENTIRVFESTNCPQDFTTQVLPDGDYQFGYQTPDEATGLPGEPTTIDFTVDTTPDDTTPPVITPTVSGPQGANGWYTGDVSVSWTETDPESAVSSTTGCGSVTVTTDTAGTTYTCSATSLGGTSSKSVTIKRDTGTPAAPHIVSGPANPSGSAAANFGVSSSLGAGDHLVCRMSPPDSAFGPCPAGFGYTGLLDGSHTFSVKAVDDAGHESAADSYTWVIDTTPPTLTITGAPDSATGDTDATFTFTSNESPVSYTCTLDGQTVPCHSGTPYSGLAIGTHSFMVYATDAAGNQGIVQARVWEIVNPPGCNVEGHVHGNQNFYTTINGKKANVHVEADGDCDKDKKTGRIYLHHSKVKVELSGTGANKLIDAKQKDDNPKYTDITSVTLTQSNPGSAIIRGTYNGYAFTVTLTDGGKPNQNDSVQVSYPGFPTDVLKAPHQDVHIEWH
jgi:hypothetical protein